MACIKQIATFIYLKNRGKLYIFCSLSHFCMVQTCCYNWNRYSISAQILHEVINMSFSWNISFSHCVLLCVILFNLNKFLLDIRLAIPFQFSLEEKGKDNSILLFQNWCWARIFLGEKLFSSRDVKSQSAFLIRGS